MTEEDEAFDEIARKQGHWGGGFMAKRAMAADKLQEPTQEPIHLLEARKIAAEYGMPDLQIDSGNLYFALMKCLKHIDAQLAQEQRPWVGLTEEDFSAINQSCLTKLQAATSAESILKEKNNG